MNRTDNTRASQSVIAQVKQSLVASAGDIVFGMEDGTVSIFGLVFGVAASSTSSAPVLLAGATGAVAAAVSMMAVGLAGVAPAMAGLAAVLGLAGAAGLVAAAWPNDIDADTTIIPRIASALRMDAPWKRSVDC